MTGTSIRVIGIGTRYRGDDAVALIVAERLRARVSGALEIMTHEGEGVSLLERFRGAKAAILIDAMNSGVTPGTLQRFDANAKPLPLRAFRHSTHAISVAEAIELGRALGQLPPYLIVYGIEGHDFTAGARLSHAVESSLSNVIEQLLNQIDEIVRSVRAGARRQLAR